jgi:hypothetical protein
MEIWWSRICKFTISLDNQIANYLTTYFLKMKNENILEKSLIGADNNYRVQKLKDEIPSITNKKSKKQRHKLRIFNNIIGMNQRVSFTILNEKLIDLTFWL